MITVEKLEEMPPQRKEALCKAMLDCANRWYVEDPAHEVAYQKWLGEYKKCTKATPHNCDRKSGDIGEAR